MITVNGELQEYCYNCPIMKLEARYRSWTTQPIFACEYEILCARLWDRLSTIKKAENERL